MTTHRSSDGEVEGSGGRREPGSWRTRMLIVNFDLNLALSGSIVVGTESPKPKPQPVVKDGNGLWDRDLDGGPDGDTR